MIAADARPPLPAALVRRGIDAMTRPTRFDQLAFDFAKI
jgi:hypothetical protein